MMKLAVVPEKIVVLVPIAQQKVVLETTVVLERIVVLEELAVAIMNLVVLEAIVV